MEKNQSVAMVINPTITYMLMLWKNQYGQKYDPGAIFNGRAKIIQGVSSQFPE